MYKLIKELKQNPKSIAIYGTERIDAPFLESIKKYGILDPLIIKSDGTIVSGHRRYAAAKKINIESVPVMLIDYRDEFSERIAIIEFNRYRKKTAWQRQREADEIETLEKEKAKQRQKELGRTQGKDPCGKFATRGKSRDKVAEAIGMKPTSFVRERKIYNAAIQRGDKVAKELMDKLSDEKISIDKAFKIMQESEKQKEREKNREKYKNINIDIDIRLGDFENILSDIPDNSVDLILTDPPYSREFLQEWSKLAYFAKSKLKTNGYCIAYSGQINLDEVMSRMSEHLDYFWTLSLIHNGTRQLINPRNVFCCWKPILIYQKGIKKSDVRIEDIVYGSGREKMHHRWQQGLAEIETIIKHFSMEGELIVDPFAGSATTLITATKLKRRAIGAEIDEIKYYDAKSRIAESSRQKVVKTKRRERYLSTQRQHSSRCRQNTYRKILTN